MDNPSQLSRGDEAVYDDFKDMSELIKSIQD